MKLRHKWSSYITYPSQGSRPTSEQEQKKVMRTMSQRAKQHELLQCELPDDHTS